MPQDYEVTFDVWTNALGAPERRSERVSATTGDEAAAKAQDAASRAAGTGAHKIVSVLPVTQPPEAVSGARPTDVDLGLALARKRAAEREMQEAEAELAKANDRKEAADRQENNQAIPPAPKTVEDAAREAMEANATGAENKADKSDPEALRRAADKVLGGKGK